MATPPPRRSRRLRSLSPETSRPLPIRRRLNRTDPRRFENTENTNTPLEQTNNNQVEEPQISYDTSERDSLEQRNKLRSPIREGSPPISKVVPYPVYIQETPRSIQATLSTPIVGLQSPEFANFRDFDRVNKTFRSFPANQMATTKSSESIPFVVTSAMTMVGTTTAAS